MRDRSRRHVSYGNRPHPGPSISYSFTLLVALYHLAHYRAGDDHSSTSGYFLAGTNADVPLIAGSLLMTNLFYRTDGGPQAARPFSDGLSVMAWERVAVIAPEVALSAVLNLPRLFP